MKTKNMKTTIASLALTSLATCVASAAVVVTTGHQTNGTSTFTHTYVVSSTDLINGLTPTTVVGDFPAGSGTGSQAVLNDGLMPATLDTFPFSGFTGGGTSEGTRLIYTLPTPASIASIDVYGGWADTGRDDQNYSVFYATSLDPTTFVFLQTVNFNPTPGGRVVSKSTISENVTGILATDVKALRFDFLTHVNNWAGYAEIDVNAVPEPSAALLGGLGLLDLLIRRRK